MEDYNIYQTLQSRIGAAKFGTPKKYAEANAISRLFDMGAKFRTTQIISDINKFKDTRVAFLSESPGSGNRHFPDTYAWTYMFTDYIPYLHNAIDSTLLELLLIGPAISEVETTYEQNVGNIYTESDSSCRNFLLNQRTQTQSYQNYPKLPKTTKNYPQTQSYLNY
jgi:hypothetical protein